MSNNRLDEGTIRRFMGLAGLQPLGEGFLDRLDPLEEMPEEEDAMAPEVDPAAEEAPPAEDMGIDDAEAPADPAAADAAAEIAQDVANAVADAMTDALGKHGVTVDAGAGEEAALGAEEDPMADMGEPEAEAAPEEMPPVEDEAPLQETTDEDETTTEETAGDDTLTKLESSNVELVDDEKVVQEVARRVAARLLRTANKR